MGIKGLYKPGRLLSSLLILGLFLNGSPAAGQAAPVGPAQPGCSPNALIVLANTTDSSLPAAIQQIEQAGGCGLHVFPPSALIGSLPGVYTPARLKALGIRAVYTDEVDPALLASAGPAAQIAAGVWNQNFANPPQPPANPTQGRPLVGDDRRNPRLSGGLGKIPAVSPSGAPGFYQTSEFMAGKIAVGIILPESNGVIDRNREDWDAVRINTAIAQIQEGLTWWAGTNPNGHLSFYYDIHTQVPTGYEPITRSSSEDHLWISESLSYLGFSQGGWTEQSYQYLNFIRAKYNTDWALVTFVVDDEHDSDHMFSDGYFGYTYGFLIVMTYHNDGWGIENMHNVMAHEFAHDFGAGDEYCSPGYACCWGQGSYGYLGIPNRNCEAGCDHNNNGICDGNDSDPNSNCHNCPSCVEVNCLMRNGSTDYGVDIPSRQQVGMRDQDNDGLLDPVDTIPAINLTVTPPDITRDNTPTFAGLTEDIPFHSPSGNDVTINFITAVEYQLDGSGDWLPSTPSDGSFDQVEENFTLTTAPLSEGNHTIAIRSTNRVGNAFTASDTFVVDAQAPTGSIVINNGLERATSPRVTLTLAASDDGSGVSQMQVSNYSDFAGATWQPYAPSLAWLLPNVAGSHTVYARYQDGAANLSPVYQASILLEWKVFLPGIAK